MGQRIQLPAPATPPLPALEVTVLLEEVTYTLHMQWSETDSGWYLRVLDEPGQTVLMGDVRMVADWPMYKSRIPEVRTPPGLLMVVDTSGRGVDPGLGDLGAGARCQLVYFTAAEVAAATG